ncbi:hypothetical protein GALL_191970 [mine drainage metagenome]|uniref:Uncharacterized protein n=1 Tax=mine drainage metagenome TaxID=410659 RepID=A0A1J5RSN0_9ZZZZ
MRLAQIEGRRTDQVADVLDHQQRAPGELQSLQRPADHLRVEMAAAAGVDLDRAGAGGADPLGVAVGLLVALDHCDRQAAAQQLYGPDQQRGLARARAGDQVQGEDAEPGQALTVRSGEGVVLGQDILLDLHPARRRDIGVGVFEGMVVGMARRLFPAATASAAHGPLLPSGPPRPLVRQSGQQADYSTSSSLTRISVPPVTRTW